MGVQLTMCPRVLQDDIVQEVQGRVLTRCVLGVPGHWCHQRHDPQAATRSSAGEDAVYDTL